MMSNAIRPSLPLIGLLGLALLLAPTLAWAEDFPAPKDAPATAEEGWSKPTEAAAGTAAASNAPARQATSKLPPPRVVRRRSGSTPVRDAGSSMTPVRTQRANPTTVSRVRSERPAVGPAGSPDGTRVTTSMPSGQATAGRLAPTCRVLSIKKTHNVQSDTVDAGGPLFLQLDVEYEVIGQQGRDVFVGVWFARTDSGKLIQSLTHDYRDSAGNVTIQTRWSRVMGPRMKYAATLLIPYYTFPAHEAGDSYQIDARVQVLRNEAQRGRVTLLARDKTTFRVHGMSEEERDRANARNRQNQVLDTRGFASPGLGEIDEVGVPEGLGARDVAGETGTILTPGIQDGTGTKATPGEAGRIIDVPTTGNAGTR